MRDGHPGGYEEVVMRCGLIAVLRVTGSWMSCSIDDYRLGGLRVWMYGFFLAGCGRRRVADRGARWDATRGEGCDGRRSDGSVRMSRDGSD